MAVIEVIRRMKTTGKIDKMTLWKITSDGS